MFQPSPFMRVTAPLLSFCGAHAAETTARPGHPSREGVLANPRTALFWEGSVGPEDAPVGGESAECATVPCDYFRLKIAWRVPAGTAPEEGTAFP